MTRALLARCSIVILVVGVTLAACFERVSDGPCPADKSINLNGVCFARVPDGFVIPDLAGPHDLAGADLTLGPDMIVPCMTSSSCPDTRPICASMTCRECGSTADDSECAAHNATTPKCDVPSGKCVQCRMSSDCTDVNNPVCDTLTHTCRKCSVNSECSTLVCKTSSGQCATTAEVAIVNNGPSCMPSGNPAYCEITQAIGSMKPYIAVVGSATPYNAITLPPANADYTVTIIGPGRDVATKARIMQAGNAAVTIQGNSGHTTNITIDGMQLSGPTTAATVSCSPTNGTTNVTIMRSFIDGSGQAGVSATNNCGITLDANTITGNDGGGIVVSTGSAFTITNNMIVANGTTGGNAGVIFGSSLVAGTFMFNTIAGNGTGTMAGGINCAGASGVHPTIQASIIWNNAKDAGNISATTGCTYSYVDHDDASTTTNSFNMDPLFVGAGNYHVGALSPVKDKVTAASGLVGTLPTHDYDGDTRPRAATGGYDVGADQIVP